MKNFGKYLLLIFAFLSIGGGNSYALTLAELKEDLPLSSEDLRTASVNLWGHRENPFQEIYDLSENHFFKSPSAIPESFQLSGKNPAKTFYTEFPRDLRRDIFQQIFPKHFFL